MAMLYADDHQIVDSSGSDGFVGVAVQVRGLVVMAPGVRQLSSGDIKVKRYDFSKFRKLFYAYKASVV
jgi:hypothetical protein